MYQSQHRKEYSDFLKTEFLLPISMMTKGICCLSSFMLLRMQQFQNTLKQFTVEVAGILLFSVILESGQSNLSAFFSCCGLLRGCFHQKKVLFHFLMQDFRDVKNSESCYISIKNINVFLKDFIYLFLDRGEGREKKRERNINMWLPLMHPPLGTQPTSQACALTGNQTSDPLVHRPALSTLSLTSQGLMLFLKLPLLLLNTGLEMLKNNHRP